MDAGQDEIIEIDSDSESEQHSEQNENIEIDADSDHSVQNEIIETDSDSDSHLRSVQNEGMEMDSDSVQSENVEFYSDSESEESEIEETEVEPDPRPTIIDERGDAEITEILDKRLFGDGKVYYFVKWVDSSSRVRCDWEHEETVEISQVLIRFEDQLELKNQDDARLKTYRELQNHFIRRFGEDAWSKVKEEQNTRVYKSMSYTKLYWECGMGTESVASCSYRGMLRYPPPKINYTPRISSNQEHVETPNTNNDQTTNEKPDDSQPMDTLTDNNQPIDALADNNQPIDELTDNSQPIDALADNSQPIDAMADNSQPVNALDDDSDSSDVEFVSVTEREPQEILTARMIDGVLKFLTKWRDGGPYTYMDSTVARRVCPQLVIAFYESILRFNHPTRR